MQLLKGAPESPRHPDSPFTLDSNVATCNAAETPRTSIVDRESWHQGPLLSIYRVAFSSSFTLPGDMFPNVDRIGQARCWATFFWPFRALHDFATEKGGVSYSADQFGNCNSAWGEMSRVHRARNQWWGHLLLTRRRFGAELSGGHCLSTIPGGEWGSQQLGGRDRKTAQWDLRAISVDHCSLALFLDFDP